MIDSNRQQDRVEVLMRQPLKVREQVEEVSVDMWDDFQKLYNKYFQIPNLLLTVFM